jgi:hypothetical protein
MTFWGLALIRTDFSSRSYAGLAIVNDEPSMHSRRLVEALLFETSRHLAASSSIVDLIISAFSERQPITSSSSLLSMSLQY